MVSAFYILSPSLPKGHKDFYFLKKFKAFSFTFKILMNLELIFVYG